MYVTGLMESYFNAKSSKLATFGINISLSSFYEVFTCKCWLNINVGALPMVGQFMSAARGAIDPLSGASRHVNYAVSQLLCF